MDDGENCSVPLVSGYCLFSTDENILADSGSTGFTSTNALNRWPTKTNREIPLLALRFLF